MHIAIVGPGRLGRTLALLLRQRHVEVSLCGRDTPVPSCSGVLLTVPDGEIANAAARIDIGQIVLHCSGSRGLEPLRPHAPAGSLHPLMTFPGPEVCVPQLHGVGAAVAGDPEAVVLAQRLCDVLGLVPLEIHGDRRLYHAAAVMAGNFATVLLADAARLLAAAGAEPEVAARTLAPLALASIRGAVPHPEEGLTGPAARGDMETITGHLQALDELGFSSLMPTYSALTERALDLAGRSVAPTGLKEGKD